MRRLWLLVFMVLGFGTLARPTVSAQRADEGKSVSNRTAEACAPCHQTLYNSYIATAHYRTSAPPSSENIHGHFDKRRNLVKTSNRTTYFRMEAKKDGFFQTAYWRDGSRQRTRAERFDIVVGSGRKGQTYLYWKDGLLYQLPVSYLVGIDDWVNSPGFIDGEVNFQRTVTPRCLECHSTYFSLTGTRQQPRYAEDYQLGITCAKCHGPSENHIAYHSSEGATEAGGFILNPRHFSRARQLDSCGLCHSGDRQPIRPPFSYQPGANLGLYLRPESKESQVEPDVHASQIGMIKRSRCFIENETLTCSTCHNVHQPETDLAQMSRKCQFCHAPMHCGFSQEVGAQITDLCVECHMPNQESRVLKVNRPGQVISPKYRNHIIAVYPNVAEAILSGIPNSESRIQNPDY